MAARLKATRSVSRSHAGREIRVAPGIRSTSEVYMHIVMANFGLLGVTGPKVPADLKEGMEKSVTSKTEVIN